MNFHQIAVLRWYAANQTAVFPAGQFPIGLGVRRDHIWAASAASNNLSKL